MKLQFIFSLLICILAMIPIAYSLFKIIRSKFSEAPISNKSHLVSIAIFLAIGGISFCYLLESSFHYAKRGTNAALSFSKEAIASTVSFGTTAILEGFGQSYDYFKAKWNDEALKHSNSLSIKLVSSNITKDNELQLNLIFKNTSSEPINLNYLLSNQIILISSSENIYYPIEKIDYDKSEFPPNSQSTRELNIKLPSSFKPSYINTPSQKIEISIQKNI